LKIYDLSFLTTYTADAAGRSRISFVPKNAIHLR